MTPFALPRRPRRLHPLRTAPLAAALALAAAMATPAQAQQAGPLRVEVVDRNTGRSLPVYRHHGEYWVEGRPGARYGLRLDNRSGERVLAVIAIDGVNVLTGETAASTQAGYVFDPVQSSQINGWRKSSTEVAAFHFTALPDSYAARTGRPDDVGVIGVAVFDEYRRPPPPPIRYEHHPSPRSSERGRMAGEAADAASPAPAAEKSARAQAPSLGTGHGRREASYAQTTQFERASSSPAAVLRLRYDSRAQLIAMGVLPGHRPGPRQPNPFPAEGGYVPDPPPRWR